MKTTTDLHHGQWWAGVGLLVAALAAILVTIAINFQAGLIVSLEIAFMLALADMGKVLIPVTARGTGWTLHTRLAYVIVTATSIACAFIFVQAHFGAVQRQEANHDKLVANADQRIAEAKASVTEARQMAAQEAKNGGCAAKCQNLMAEASRREAGVAQAVEARRSLPAKGVTPKAGASLLLTILAIASLELLSHMAGPAVSVIASSSRSQQTEVLPPQKRKKTKKANDKNVIRPQFGGKTSSQIRIKKNGQVDGRCLRRLTRQSANSNAEQFVRA